MVSYFQDEGQKSIVSFFQKATAPKPQLFSEHGKSTSCNSKQPSCILINDDDGDDFKPEKPNKIKENAKKEIVTTPGKGSSSGSKENIPVTCIPETQLLFTPPGKSDQAAFSNASKKPDSLSSSFDFGLIPDTPVNKQEAAKTKRPIGRSFLMSATEMSSNPIQKAKENRAAKLLQKKQASQARKGLMTVSVNINTNQSKEMKPDVSGNYTDSKIALTGIKTSENVTEPKENAAYNCKTLQDVTPTKVYADSCSIKRMAKSGDSPEHKRSNGLEMEADGAEINQSPVDKVSKQLGFHDIGLSDPNVVNSDDKCNQSEKVMVFKSAKTKLLEIEQERRKQIPLLDGDRLEMELMKYEEKKKLNEKLLKYQLTGSMGLYITLLFMI